MTSQDTSAEQEGSLTADDARKLASGPTQEHAYTRGPRITALETVVPYDVMPGM